MLATCSVGVVLRQRAVTDDEQLDVFEEAGPCPEAVALVAINLVKRLADVHTAALELHMHQRQPVDENSNVIPVRPSRASRSLANLILVNDLQPVVVYVLLVDEMCRGAVDRRLFDRDPDTALKNIVSLVEGLWVLDGVVPCNTWLSLDRRRALLKLLLQGMAGTETVAGLISTVDAEDRQAAVKAMAEAPELVADLLMSAIEPEGRIQNAVIFDWQPLLNRALALGMARGRTDADRERLTRLAEFMDDEHWQERTSKAANLWFELIREGGAWIVLTGEPEELFDSRAVAQIIGAWFRYDGLVRGSRLGLRFGHSPSRVGSDRWRVALAYGAGCFASWPDIGASGVSTERLSQGIVDKFAEAELTLRYLFPDAPIRERASA